MNKQEAIEEIKKQSTQAYDDFAIMRDTAIHIVNQIDEPKKVTIPKFVAEWIVETEKIHNNLSWVWFSNPVSDELNAWLKNHTETFMRAWLDGYEVETEKLYTVEIPNPNLNAHVVLQKTGDGLVLVTVGNARWRGWESSKLTEAEIKQDFDFLWQLAKEAENE